MKHGLLKKLVWLLIIAPCSVAQAQQDSMISKHFSKPTFKAIVNGGLILGANTPAVQLQAITGMQYKNWFAGIGGGLDYYYLRSVPLFVEVRKTFSNPYALFVYAGAGWNLPWVTRDQKAGPWYTSRFKKGWYYDAGIGWQASIGKRHAVLLSAGYSGKNFEELQKPLSTPPVVNEDDYTTRLSYSLRRLSLKIGFQL
jgi:hypothetical protein